MRRRLALWAGLALAALASPWPTGAAPRTVETYDASSWAQLQAGPAAVVVFTTTDCAHCPAVIERLALELRQRRLGARLVAVVMDQAPGDDDHALLADTHYQPADRLLAFAAPAAALRHQVDPRWRGVTPFVAFLAPGQAVATVAGPPSPSLLQQFASGLSPRR